MRLLFLFSLLANLVVAQDISFINPEPQPAGQKNFALNPSYVIGSSLLIQWSSTNQNISLVLYQERPNDLFEYVFQNSFGISSFRWNVGTQKDLNNGRVFFFQIFITGQTSPTATSRYFNLTREQTNDDPTSSSSSKAATSTTLTSVVLPTGSSTTSTASATASSSGTSTSTPSSTPAPDTSGGLGTGAKVGLGVGIPIAIGLGLVAGWFFFGRKRKTDNSAYYNASDGPQPIIPQETKYVYTSPGATNYAHNSPHEAPSEVYTPISQPSELASQRY